MSASIHWIAWKSAIAWPNWRRALACSTDASSAACRMPTASAPMPTRPLSSTLIIIWKPRFSSPSSASGGSAHGVEVQRADRRGALAHLVLVRAAAHAGPVEVDDEDAHAALAGLGVGAREHGREIGDRRVVDPQLAAVEPPAGRGARRGGADAGDVRARVGLGDRVGGAALRGEQRAQVVLALRRAAVGGKQRGDQLDQPALVGDGGVAAREFLHHDRVGHAVRARRRRARRRR